VTAKDEALQGLAGVGVIKGEHTGVAVDDAGSLLRNVPHTRILGQDTPAALPRLAEERDVFEHLSGLVAVMVAQGYSVQSVHLADLVGNLGREASVHEHDEV
jgi:hypothetical protein